MRNSKLLTFTLLGSAIMLAGIAAPAIGKGTPPSSPKPKVTRQLPAPTYTCPMDPEVSSKKPGSCPKCGMTLEKKPTK